MFKRARYTILVLGLKGLIELQIEEVNSFIRGMLRDFESGVKCNRA